MKKTYDRIIEAMERLLYRTSYSKITIQMIMDECHISRQAFYKYFSDKNELCKAMYFEYIQQGLSCAEGYDWEKLILHFLTVINSHRNFFAKSAKDRGAETLYEILFQHIFLLYQTTMTTHAQKDLTEDLEMLLRMYCMGGVRLLIEWITAGSATSPEKLCELFRRGMPSELQELLLASKIQISMRQTPR